MPELQPMPEVRVSQETLANWGEKWLAESGGRSNRFDKSQAMEFGHLFDQAFGAALATMLGGIPVVTPHAKALTPPHPDCVEVGTTRVIGGIRPQNYDAAYRPDGPRVVFDSKTLNDEISIRKNWQNMINDLASEAATLHTRFPFCIVAFIVVLPDPAVPGRQLRAIASTLQRLGSRKDELDQHHLAEAIALVLWNPHDGTTMEPPAPYSSIRLGNLHHSVQTAYADRYRHLPPHTS